MDGRIDGRMDGWLDGQMDGRTDGWMDGQMNGWMDGVLHMDARRHLKKYGITKREPRRRFEPKTSKERKSHLGESNAQP